MRNRLALWALALLLPLVALPSLAWAQGSSDQDPLSLLAQLYSFVHTGHGVLAAGAATMLLVWLLRSGLSAKWSFWKNPVGGYLLGFGVPMLTYLGLAWQQGQPVTVQLILSALSAGYVAAGGWNHVQDLIDKLRKPPAGNAVSSTSEMDTPTSQQRPTTQTGPAKRLVAATAVMALATACSGAQNVATVGGSAAAGCAINDLVRYGGEVLQALASESFGQALDDVAKKHNLTVDMVSCLVQGVVSVLAAQTQTTPSTARESVVVEHGKAWLAQHGGSK